MANGMIRSYLLKYVPCSVVIMDTPGEYVLLDWDYKCIGGQSYNTEGFNTKDLFYGKANPWQK